MPGIGLLGLRQAYNSFCLTTWITKLLALVHTKQNYLSKQIFLFGKIFEIIWFSQILYPGVHIGRHKGDNDFSKLLTWAKLFHNLFSRSQLSRTTYLRLRVLWDSAIYRIPSYWHHENQKAAEAFHIRMELHQMLRYTLACSVAAALKECAEVSCRLNDCCV